MVPEIIIDDYNYDLPDEKIAKYPLSHRDSSKLLKYIDGNVKAQNPDGSFITNEHTDCIPAKISQPGYTAKWKEATAKDNGSILEEK